MIDKLITAIQRREVLKISYFPGVRLIEPHTLGEGASGQLLLRAFQIDGVSKSGERSHWKLFRVDQLQLLESTSQQFNEPRNGYSQNDRVMKPGIIAEL